MDFSKIDKKIKKTFAPQGDKASAEPCVQPQNQPDKRVILALLDAAKRSQILFMDREDIVNLHIVSNLPLPAGVTVTSSPDFDDDILF